MSTSFGAQPSSSISKSEFLSSLPRWRRWLSRLNWHPTIDVDVERYEIEQRLQRLESENARLAQINSRLERFEREHLSGSIPPPSTGDSYS